MKILVSWSSGKDAAWMLHRLHTAYPGAVAGLVTTTTAAFDRVAMHGVRREVVEAQARAAQLPLHVVPLPWPCSNDDYERIMRDANRGFVRDGFTHVAFGDLFLEDVRQYRIDRLAGTGLTPLFPLWRCDDTRGLAETMIDAGLDARVVTVDPRVLDRSFAGRAFDRALLEQLPDGVDACGERGEFHTCASAGPMFVHPIRLVPGEVVTRDGFVFADLMLAAPGAQAGPDTRSRA